MTSESLALFAGALLSLIASYIPGFNVAFAKLDSTTKSLAMAAALLVVALAIFGSSCAQLGLSISVPCDKAGAVGLATTFLMALMVNQAVFHISPQLTEVKVAKADAAVSTLPK